MNENSNIFATDFHGFTRIRQRMKQAQSFPRLARFTFLREWRSRFEETPAAERRHLLAQDVSPGYAARNGIESRRDGRGYLLQPMISEKFLRVPRLQVALWNERAPACI
jgi:hypothetical protein